MTWSISSIAMCIPENDAVALFKMDLNAGLCVYAFVRSILSQCSSHPNPPPLYIPVGYLTVYAVSYHVYVTDLESSAKPISGLLTSYPSGGLGLPPS